jgi:quinol monooxygenase YgiN
MVWTVAERFTDPAAFNSHQARAATSDWARATVGIARDYKISGLE